MKDFLKFTFATVVGIVISSVLLVFISIVMLVGIVSSSDTETKVPDNAIAVFDLKGDLSERSQENPLGYLMGNTYTSCGLDDVLSAIKKAKENEKIKGIYLKASSLNAAYASLQAIRNALQDFKESGKFVVAYGDTYTQGMYYVASVADKVVLNPKGMLEWRGLAANPIFYKNLLDKIGVEMQVFRVGTYKSAVEPFTSTGMSPANREQMDALLRSTWGQVTAEVAASRNLSVEKLNELADNMMMFDEAEKTVQCGLADTLLYKNEMRNYLKAMAGVDEDDTLPTLSMEEVLNIRKNTPKDKSGNIVAVYYATGEIVEEDSSSPMSPDGSSVISAAKVLKDLRKLQEDDHVKAVVLRVNSPGGSAYASEQIWHAVSELKKEKPVIVSMSDYAASGGYYISCNADTIVAEPTTLTGSIGIFGLVPDVTGLTKKLGLDFDVVKTNTYADFGSMGRGMNAGERNLMQNYVNRGYDLFLTRCSEGRGIGKDDLDKIAQGRVWTGSMAKDLGLVDELGGLDRALEIAIGKCGLTGEGYTVLSYPKKESFLEILMNINADSYVKARMLNGKAGELYRQLSILENADKCERIQARLPFEPNIR